MPCVVGAGTAAGTAYGSAAGTAVDRLLKAAGVSDPVRRFWSSVAAAVVHVAIAMSMTPIDAAGAAMAPATASAHFIASLVGRTALAEVQSRRGTPRAQFP
jgi:hypothetical protein